MYTFYNEVLEPVLKNIDFFADRNAFFINDKYYTYKEFGQEITTIRSFLQSTKYSNHKVGLVINDDIETYASIFALWLEGNCYVPLHPGWPIERCQNICEQVKLDMILDSSEQKGYKGVRVIKTSVLQNEKDNLSLMRGVSDEELAYILFTSGSTGIPKGVQLSRKNLASFVDAFFDVYDVDENDKCLQCFDLSFDLSIMSYLIPLLKGACVFTVPSNVVKYSFIGGLIEEERLTIALMAPSTIKYLKPYFDEIDCSSLKYSLFCGEALPLNVTKEWAKCAPNAIVDNAYGPTEDTIFCSIYRYNREQENKTYNGILSIGKPMKGCGMAVFDENKNECSNGTLGELCLAGNQLTKGYHNNEEKNREAFFEKDGVRWYRTGDLCYKDKDGDFMYSGRLDHQTKIQGFRVEMGEIEFHAREFLNGKNVVCLAFDNKNSITEIAMFIESEEFDTDKLINYMREKMPSYMIPSKILFVPVFPLNTNDKIDKVKLKEMV